MHLRSTAAVNVVNRRFAPTTATRQGMLSSPTVRSARRAADSTKRELTADLMHSLGKGFVRPRRCASTVNQEYRIHCVS
jgi:hypothetical protein